MTRVRVTRPRAGASTPAQRPETAEESEVGQLFVRSLIRSQLRLALVVAGGFLLLLVALPFLVAAVPGLDEISIAGIPFAWLLLGAGIYPLIALSAWLFIRTAARNEERYRDLAGER